ncbi:hypothetical protein M427DRAFT_29233 [Gonapodya prolifera JEL478]|uniref:Uncharacterized protein n=1 Tax=Gonapodya prolifera (strain JEL478) TaxID=1344416 RepID=A0A139ARF0_GONPJ|nr:hypothetical protein M427DRAFT_29233 [Gonapodya prolifera JEL478]|eukprot:KXS19302.1 hypothetical protein M427DRAFT_29233 [Gonapodya prolifera JEL478]
MLNVQRTLVLIDAIFSRPAATSAPGSLDSDGTRSLINTSLADFAQTWFSSPNAGQLAVHVAGPGSQPYVLASWDAAHQSAEAIGLQKLRGRVDMVSFRQFVVDGGSSMLSSSLQSATNALSSPPPLSQIGADSPHPIVRSLEASLSVFASPVTGPTAPQQCLFLIMVPTHLYPLPAPHDLAAALHLATLATRTLPLSDVQAVMLDQLAVELVVVEGSEPTEPFGPLPPLPFLRVRIHSVSPQNLTETLVDLIPKRDTLAAEGDADVSAIAGEKMEGPTKEENKELMSMVDSDVYRLGQPPPQTEADTKREEGMTWELASFRPSAASSRPSSPAPRSSTPPSTLFSTLRTSLTSSSSPHKRARVVPYSYLVVPPPSVLPAPSVPRADPPQGTLSYEYWGNLARHPLFGGRKDFVGRTSGMNWEVGMKAEAGERGGAGGVGEALGEI